MVELTKKVSKPETTTTYPSRIATPALRAFYDNLPDMQPSTVSESPEPYAGQPATDGREESALALDRAIRRVKKADWRGNRFEEREVRNAISGELADDSTLVDAIFEIVKAQRDY